MSSPPGSPSAAEQLAQDPAVDFTTAEQHEDSAVESPLAAATAETAEEAVEEAGDDATAVVPDETTEEHNDFPVSAEEVAGVEDQIHGACPLSTRRVVRRGERVEATESGRSDCWDV